MNCRILRIAWRIVVFVAMSAAAGAAQSATLSFSGALGRDDGVAVFSFSVEAAGEVVLRTFSYAGGTGGTGLEIPPGGFDPVLSLFDSAGNLVLFQDEPTPECDGVNADPLTSECFDVRIVTQLDAGEYLVALSQFDNLPVGPDFNAGFSRSGADFTAIFGCVAGQFCDVDGESRTSAWAAEVAGGTVVPLPGVAWLWSLGLGGAAALFRKRRAAGSLS